MKKSIFVVGMLAVMVSGSAFAKDNGKEPPAWGLNKTKTTNNVTNNTTNNGGSAQGGSAFSGSVATGGQGGAGGEGGVGVGIGGAGGSAIVTVNGVEPGASVIAPGTAAVVAPLATDGTATGSLVSSTTSTSVSNTNTYEAAASTAYAPALTSGMDTCMGSSSVGGSGVGFGFSVGTTWNDENCVRLKNAREMAAMGYKNVAVAMMCQDAKVREAAESIGSPVCASAAKKADGSKKKQDVATGPDMSDPYIAMRLK